LFVVALMLPRIMEVINLIQHVCENDTRFGAHMSHMVLFARSGDQMKSKDAVPLDLQDPQNVAQIVGTSKLHSTFDPRSSIFYYRSTIGAVEAIGSTVL
jgi:hypothetical protein